MTPSVWIIDDDKSIRWVLEKALTRAGISYASFTNADDALNALYDTLPKVILSDIRMPGTDGLKFLATVKAEHPTLPVIVMTAHSDLDSAVAAFQGGAFEYLPKPFDVDQAVQLVERALGEAERDNAGPDAMDATPVMLGQAPAMQDVFRAIGRLSQSSVTVLITGESGSGKELVAHALHRHSNRAAKAFIAINTAAIPRDLLESELFGHERGSFTGATTQRRGRFEEAEGGTLFLDEIGELPLAAQAKLLRALEERRVRPVGSEQEIPVNARVVAATNRDLAQEVAAGRFRQDLYYRLQVMEIELPALRERPEDIPELINHFTRQLAGQLGVPPVHPDAASLRRLQGYDWPGNVRELRNLVERSLIFGYYDLKPEPASAAAEAGAALPAQPEVLLEAVEKRHILAVLNACGGNKSEAARQLGVSRKTLDRKCNAWGV